MTRKLSQTERVLRELRRAGPRGVCGSDFLLPNVCDGGKPIARLAARVHDLKDAGHEIVTDGVRDEFAVYKLRREATMTRQAEEARDVLADVRPVVLPEHPAGARCALFDWDEEAA